MSAKRLSNQRQFAVTSAPGLPDEEALRKELIDETPLTPQNLLTVLHYLPDLSKLETSPLIHLSLVAQKVQQGQGVDNPAERARCLRQILIDSIQALCPTEGPPDYAEEPWLDFIILINQYQNNLSPVYVLGDINATLTERHGPQHTLSESTYFRGSKRARNRLLERLQEAEERARQRIATTDSPILSTESGPLACADRPTWMLLRQISHEISVTELYNRTRDNPQLCYLQRVDLLRAFDSFLKSAAACFLLTGASGAGKSSFLRSLLVEYANHPNLCLLMLDAAQFTASMTLRHYVTDALAAYKGLPLSTQTDVWEALDSIGGTGEGRVVLVLDELTNNRTHVELLREVNALMGRRHWLKIVLVSRAEAWRTLRREVPLKTRLFFVEEPAPTKRESESPPASSWHLLPFSDEEARIAYERYRSQYDLKTDYDDLEPETQALVRNPLCLSAVAAIHRGGEVQSAIPRERLAEDYLQALLNTHRLQQQDRQLLVHELIPRLERTPGVYTRRLDEDQLHDNADLCRRVFGLTHDGPDSPADGSIERLVDAGILASHRHDARPYIELQDSLVFDHLFGRYLFDRHIKEATNKPAAGEDLCMSAERWPVAWNAIVRALHHGLREFPEPMREILLNNSEEVSEPCRAALLEFVASDPEKARQIMRWMVEGCGKLRRKPSASPVVRSARIALDAGAQLGDTDTFIALLTARETTIRELALHRAFLWGKQQPAAVLRVIDSLSMEVTRPRFGLDMRALESTVSLIPLIAVDCWERGGLLGDSLAALLSISRNLMQSIERKQSVRVLRRIARAETAIGALWLAYRLLNEGAHTNAFNDPVVFNRFFQRSPDVRSRALDALEHIDRNSCALEDLSRLLCDLYSSQDHVSELVADAIMMSRGIHTPSVVSPVLRTLLETVQDPTRAFEAHACSVWCECVIRQREISKDALRFMSELVERALLPDANGAYGMVCRDGRRHSYRPLHYYLRLWVRAHPGRPADLAEQQLKTAHRNGDEQLLLQVIDSYADLLDLPNNCAPVLGTLAPYANADGIVRERVARSLAALASVQPTLLFGFLREVEAPVALQEEISRATSDRPMRSHYMGLLPLTQDFIAYAPNSVLRPVLSVCHQALESRSPAGAAIRLAEGMLKLLSGEAN